MQRKDRRGVAGAEFSQDLRRLQPIKRRDRLVPDDDLAAVVKGAGDRNALLLTARQRTRFDEQFVREANDLEHALYFGDVATCRQ